MCKAADRNKELEVDTWCGDFVDNTRKHICEINALSDAKHCVRLVSLRPRDMKVYVRGSIEKHKARFQGDSTIIQNEAEWNYATTLYARFGLHEETFGPALIIKKVNGSEIVKLEVEYEDHWNHEIKRTADSSRLTFKIKVV